MVMKEMKNNVPEVYKGPEWQKNPVLLAQFSENLAEHVKKFKKQKDSPKQKERRETMLSPLTPGDHAPYACAPAVLGDVRFPTRRIVQCRPWDVTRKSKQCAYQHRRYIVKPVMANSKPSVLSI